jgi:hypothetical protein
MRGRDLGLLNPRLYQLASDPTSYAKDFFDVTVGTNQQLMANGQPTATPGFNASRGWDAVTGLGTPGAAGGNLIADLAATP